MRVRVRFSVASVDVRVAQAIEDWIPLIAARASVAAPSYLLLISRIVVTNFSDAALELSSGGSQRLTALWNRRLKELLTQTLIDPRGNLIGTNLARNSLGQRIEPFLDSCQRRNATVELQVQLFSLRGQAGGRLMN
jgi:hypothetical protein